MHSLSWRQIMGKFIICMLINIVMPILIMQGHGNTFGAFSVEKNLLLRSYYYDSKFNDL